MGIVTIRLTNGARMVCPKFRILFLLGLIVRSGILIGRMKITSIIGRLIGGFPSPPGS